MHNHSLVHALAIWMCLSTGCAQNESAAGPRESEAGTRVYALRAVAGDELPAVTLDNDYVTIVTIADTVLLGSGGAGVRVVVEQTTEKPGGKPVVRRDEHPFSYETAAGRIALSFECNDVIIRMCVAPPHFVGDFTEARLTFHSALYNRAPMVYGRI